MGLDDQAANQAIRFSLGKYNTTEEVEFVIEKVRLTLEELNPEMVQVHNRMKT
jgi:cysteine sulfinate desulfinase/cysteine desulfurase-like protein